MSHKDILERAITKAIDGEWSGEASGHMFWSEEPLRIADQIDSSGECLNDLIFNHEFAKALWGEELHHETFIVPKELNKRFAGSRHLDVKPIWQYHLQQMVISDDPVRYLGENL